MAHLFLIAVLACTVPLYHARQADTKPYIDTTCRDIKSMGKNTCALCNWTGVPHCDEAAYWDMCADKQTPNPCNANEILIVDARDYKFNYDDTCKRVCPNQYCYSTTNVYTDTCCSCPSGYRPSVTPPTCVRDRGEGVHLTCVGCNSADEMLVGDDQKGWECLPKPRTSSSAKATTTKPTTSTSITKPTTSSTCDRTCSKDTWCPAHWVTKQDPNGRQRKLCQCTSGNCKDKDATCPTACRVKNAAVPTNCPAVTCPKVQDKDKCFPNNAGLDLIKSQESLCTTFYNVCDGVKTIGWGHNCDSHKDCAGLKLPLSLCEADRLFRCDVTELMQYVKRLPNYARLSANQFSALVSLAFQYPKAFAKDGTLWKHMNVEAIAFDYKVICKDILGATSGYQDRRKKEQELCLKEPVTPMKC